LPLQLFDAFKYMNFVIYPALVVSGNVYLLQTLSCMETEVFSSLYFTQSLLEGDVSKLLNPLPPQKKSN
jgi:hypothetical protein